LSDCRFSKIHNLLISLIPDIYEKLYVSVINFEHPQIKCKKNQKRALLVINDNRNITASQLGRKLIMEKGSLTSLIDSLLEMGLIDKRPDPTDQRKYLLSVSPQGQEYLSEMELYCCRNLNTLLNNWDDQDIKDLTDSLTNILILLKRL
jgi:DNA-binding MarR family transcriptional regulator